MVYVAGFKNVYRVSNNGKVGKTYQFNDEIWRPQVSKIEAFSDQDCSNKISSVYVGESGHAGNLDGSKAFDN